MNGLTEEFLSGTRLLGLDTPGPRRQAMTADYWVCSAATGGKTQLLRSARPIVVHPLLGVRPAGSQPQTQGDRGDRTAAVEHVV